MSEEQNVITIVFVGSEGAMDKAEGEYAVMSASDAGGRAAQIMSEAGKAHPKHGWSLVKAVGRNDSLAGGPLAIGPDDPLDGCLLSGPGRGDCEHFVQMPDVLDETTTDVYGKPNGWCWWCWKQAQLTEVKAENEKLRDCVEELARQFGGWHSGKGGYTTNGLSALEFAFEVLGWDDPHIDKKSRCDEPGCKKQINCGWNDSKGKRRRTCSQHYERFNPEQKGGV